MSAQRLGAIAATAGAWLALIAPSVAPAAGPAARLATPSHLACPRDRVTSYSGVARVLRDDATVTRLSIATDWDTTETVTVTHAQRSAAASHFLLDGQPFAATDWTRIEREPGRIASGQRVVAWVCEDGRTPPLIDWRPGPAPSRAPSARRRS